MIRYEFDKIIKNKTVLILIAFLFAVNAVVCLYYCTENAESIPHADLYEFFKLYESDPESVTDEYGRYTKFVSEQEALWLAALEQGDFGYEVLLYPDHYSKSENYSDGDLYAELFTRKSAAEGWHEKIESVISQAETNITELRSRGFGAGDYLYDRQTMSVVKYKALLDSVKPEFEYTRGWDSFFLYESANIFIFAAVLVISSTVFTQEAHSGMLSVIRSSRRGRADTVSAKIFCALVLSGAAVVLFTLESWILIGTQSGYSSLSGCIQLFEEFTYCPYPLSVGGYLLVFVLGKIAVSFVITLIILFLSCIIGNYVMIYIVGICFFGANYLLYTIPYLNSVNILFKLNFFSLLSVNPIFEDYTLLDLFGNAVECVKCAAVFSAVLFPVFVFLVFIGYKCMKTSAASFSLMRLSQVFAHVKARLPRLNVRKRYPAGIFPYEIYKLLIANRFIAVMLLLFVLKIFLSSREFQPPRSFEDAVYEEYMTVLAGEITDEKEEYLRNERNEINRSLSSYTAMEESYTIGEISLEEYSDYLKKYTYALSHNDVFKRVEAHARYISAMKAKNRPASFVYDTGWNKMFCSGFDFSLYLAIFILFAGCYSPEYTGQSSYQPFALIMRTTSKGRVGIWRTKLLSALLLSFVLTLLWNAVDLSFILTSYTLSLPHAPIVSAEYFSSFAYDISILLYTVIFYAVKVLSAILLAVTMCSLSALLRSSIPVMTITASFTLIPALVSSFGLSLFDKFDFTGFMRATPFLMRLPSSWLYAFSLIIVDFTLTLISRKRI